MKRPKFEDGKIKFKQQIAIYSFENINRVKRLLFHKNMKKFKDNLGDDFSVQNKFLIMEVYKKFIFKKI